MVLDKVSFRVLDCNLIFAFLRWVFKGKRAAGAYLLNIAGKRGRQPEALQWSVHLWLFLSHEDEQV